MAGVPATKAPNPRGVAPTGTVALTVFVAAVMTATVPCVPESLPTKMRPPLGSTATPNGLPFTSTSVRMLLAGLSAAVGASTTDTVLSILLVT